MPGSIIVATRVAVIAGLKDTINAIPGMEDVLVDFQYPLGDDQPREVVWTQNAQLTFGSAALKSGRNFLNEDGRFDVLIRSESPARTPAESAQRALDIAEVVVEWIGDHKNADALEAAGYPVPGLNWLTVDGSGTEVEATIDSGTVASFQVPVHYQARIT